MAIPSWLRRIFGRQENKKNFDKPASKAPSDRDTQILTSSAQQLVSLINESLQLSNNSRNPETKVSRLDFAKDKLEELQAMVAKYQFLKITSLDAVQRSIDELEHEYKKAGHYSKGKPKDINSSITHKDIIDDSQNGKLDGWADDELIEGFEFCATLQLRTPLRILKRHNEQFKGRGKPPKIVDEQWQGYWSPKAKSWRDLGIDIEEAPMDTMASDVGPIPSDGGDYLKFLIAIRDIVERKNSVTKRLAELNAEMENGKWNVFVQKLGGKQAITDYFFPCFIETLPGLQNETVAALRELELSTPKAITTVPDKTLLALKGIGPAKLKKIRKACEDATDPESEYEDCVER